LYHRGIRAQSGRVKYHRKKERAGAGISVRKSVTRSRNIPCSLEMPYALAKLAMRIFQRIRTGAGWQIIARE